MEPNADGISKRQDESQNSKAYDAEKNGDLPVSTVNANDLGPAAIGRVDWSPLAGITGFRPLVSKYGLPRYSQLEWRKANQSLLEIGPCVDILDYDSKNILASVSAALDKHQQENTLNLRQRAADVYAFHNIARNYSQEIKDEMDLLAQCKVRIRNALAYCNVVDGINKECREIRKNRLTEDLVRDTVEEELFQEKGLCDEVRELYRSVLEEFENLMSALKKISIEIQAVWSNQEETMMLESENIALTSKSPSISYRQGVARHEPEMSTPDTWEKHTKATLKNVKTELDNCRNFRQKINSPVIQDSVRDLVAQGDKVVKAFLRRINETQTALQEAEDKLDKILKEIAHCEQLYVDLESLGRQIDFNLKVVQTRLNNRRMRPDVENCRDKVQYGLMNEIKNVSQKLGTIQVQLQKFNDTIVSLYALRKKLERQIHVKKHTLTIDQQRCMTYRKQFPNPNYLMGF